MYVQIFSLRLQVGDITIPTNLQDVKNNSINEQTESKKDFTLF